MRGRGVEVSKTLFYCQEVGSQIIESAIPRRISEVGPIRI